MKPQNSFLKGILLAYLILNLSACNKQEDDILPSESEEIHEEPGISADEFDAYAGEIGLIINARDIARKGYQPAKADLKIEAEYGEYSQTIPLNEISYMGEIKIPVDSLSPEARDELVSGVPMKVTIKDKNDVTLVSDVSLGTVSLLSDPLPQNVNASGLEETEESATIGLSEGTAYYIQKVDEKGNPLNMAMRWNQNPVYGSVMTVSTNTTFAGDQPDFVFNFEPVEGELNTFYIKLESTKQFVFTSLVTAIISGNFVSHNAPRNSFSTSIDPNSSLSEFFKYKIEKVKDGVYLIKDYQGNPIKEATGIGLTVNHSSGKDIYWRIVSRDISWTVQSIGTQIISPVLPRATTGFSFNSTLQNCGSGSLEQTVGANFSEQRSNSFGWEESISINTTSSMNVSATVGVEFEAKFFGTGASYNASLTTGFEWSQSVTKETSTLTSNDITKTEIYFSERVITVPPGSASLVYDVYQYYENVRIDYVQRLRLSGINEDGKALSGEEIKSMFQFTRFNGVINKVEDSSVVFTLRGYTILDKFIETQSNVEDVPSACQ